MVPYLSHIWATLTLISHTQIPSQTLPYLSHIWATLTLISHTQIPSQTLPYLSHIWETLNIFGAHIHFGAELWVNALPCCVGVTLSIIHNCCAAAITRVFDVHSLSNAHQSNISIQTNTQNRTRVFYKNISLNFVWLVSSSRSSQQILDGQK